MNEGVRPSPIAVVKEATELLRSIAPDVGQFNTDTTMEESDHNQRHAFEVALGGLELVIQAYRVKLGIDKPKEVKPQNMRKPLIPKS